MNVYIFVSYVVKTGKCCNMLLLKVHLYICVHGIGQVKFHVFEEYSSIDNDDELASLRPSKRFLNTRMSRIKTRAPVII